MRTSTLDRLIALGVRSIRGWIVGASHHSALPSDAFEDVYGDGRAAEWATRMPDGLPWCLFVSFAGPLDPPTDYARRCRGAEMPRPIPGELHGKPSWVRGRQVEAPAQQRINARSITPLSPGEPKERRTELVSAIRGRRCLRTHRCKLIQYQNDERAP